MLKPIKTSAQHGKLFLDSVKTFGFSIMKSVNMTHEIYDQSSSIQIKTADIKLLFDPLRGIIAVMRYAF